MCSRSHTFELQTYLKRNPWKIYYCLLYTVFMAKCFKYLHFSYKYLWGDRTKRSDLVMVVYYFHKSTSCFNRKYHIGGVAVEFTHDWYGLDRKKSPNTESRLRIEVVEIWVLLNDFLFILVLCAQIFSS